MGEGTFNAAVWLVDRHVGDGRGTAVAFRCGDQEVSYEDLQRSVWATANGLRSIGVGAGDRILMVVDDEMAFPAFFLAGLRIGAIPVPVSTMLRANDLAGLAADWAATAVVVSDRYGGCLPEVAAAAESVRIAMLTGPGPTNVGNRPGDAAEPAVGISVQRWASFDDQREAPVASTDSSTLGFWLYTSGTTGTPKGAIHRHGDLKATSDTYARSVLGMSRDDVCYSVPKLFFAYGLGNALTFPLAVGASAVLDPDPPTPPRISAILRRHRPSLFFATPGICAAMVDAALPPDAVSSVRATVTAGEALPAEVQRRFTERYGTEMLDGIGSTEALHIFCSNHPGDTRPGTSGRPVDGYELKLLDDEGHAVTEADVPSALWVRGASVAAGYWQRPEATAATFVDGWLRTGDVYARSVDGYYRFVGRNSDMIKAGGMWVSPAEVEDVLLEHPDVLEAAVVGGRDSHGLETTVAFVVPRTGRTIDPTALEAHCRGRMATFKRPREIHVLAELPKTATGKIQRFALRSVLDSRMPRTRRYRHKNGARQSRRRRSATYMTRQSAPRRH
jgi:benzoate-CoA ligase family protein